MSIKLGTQTIAGTPLEPTWGGIDGNITDQVDLNNALNSKISAENANLTGIPTAPTASAGTANNQIATTKFVNDSIQNIDVLPDQTGEDGKFLTTNGSNASWSIVPTIDPEYDGVTETIIF